jgi:riboflavin synthase
MFTGLVETLASVRLIEPDGQGGKNCDLKMAQFVDELALGESVAINGACLTVVAKQVESCRFQMSPETLVRTNLGQLQAGDRVNVERSLRVGDRLGGHIVQGHVDGLCRIGKREKNGQWETVWFNCPPELAAQMIPKGSVAVDGVSLTLVEVLKDRFSVALIPHTLANTTLGFKQANHTVNVEIDLFAKYVAKYLSSLSIRHGPMSP